MHRDNRVEKSDGCVYSTADLRGASGMSGSPSLGHAFPRDERMGVVSTTDEPCPTSGKIRPVLVDALFLLETIARRVDSLDCKLMGSGPAVEESRYGEELLQVPVFELANKLAARAKHVAQQIMRLDGDI